MNATELDDIHLEELEELEDEDDRRPTRPTMRSGISLEQANFAEHAELEWRLYHRGRYAPEHHKLGAPTLARLDRMYQRLAHARDVDEMARIIHDAFATEEERRAALVPLLGVLYPLAFFDEKMETKDIVRLLAHHERRTPAHAL